MSKCLKCKLSHGVELNCQFVGETTGSTPVAPAAEVTIVNVSDIIDAFGRLMTTAVNTQNSVLATRVNLLGADYVRKQEDAVTAAVTAAVTTAAAFAAPYIRRMAEAKVAVEEAKARNEVLQLDLQAQRIRESRPATAARPVQAARHAHAHRRHR